MSSYAGSQRSDHIKSIQQFPRHWDVTRSLPGLTKAPTWSYAWPATVSIGESEFEIDLVASFFGRGKNATQGR